MNAVGMIRQVTVEKLYQDNQARLGMSWVAGRKGGNKVLTGEAGMKPTIGQVGHMNFIHPFRVQILGAAELAFLRSMAADARDASINRLFTHELAAVVVANAEEVPPELLDQCNARHIALFTTPQPSPH